MGESEGGRHSGCSFGFQAEGHELKSMYQEIMKIKC